MIILLKSVTTQFRRLFSQFRIAKCNKVILLQSVTEVYYKVCQVLQSVTDFKLQSSSGITKCDIYYKVRSNTCT